MPTYLQTVNQVLRRLRESEVAQVSANDYSSLIGELVNESKREVEDAWNWNVLRTTVQVNTVAGTSRYALTTAGNRFRDLGCYNSTNNAWLTKRPHNWMTEQLLSDTSQGQPDSYDFNDQDVSGDPYVDLWKIPDAVYVLNFNLIIPQDDLSSDATSIEVPHWPVVLSAYAKAIAERGEDSGRTHGEVFMSAQKALSDAIAYDVSKDVSTSMDWYWN